MAQLIPRVTPELLRSFPDQTAKILNEVIDAVNALNRDK